MSIGPQTRPDGNPPNGVEPYPKEVHVPNVRDRAVGLRALILIGLFAVIVISLVVLVSWFIVESVWDFFADAEWCRTGDTDC